jgi:hypothetical protein
VRATLLRELGGGAREEDRRALWAAGLERWGVFETEPGRKVTSFVADRGQVVVGSSAGDVRVLPIAEDDQGRIEVDMARANTLVHSHSAVTSLSISPGRRLLYTPPSPPSRRRR